MTTVILDLGGSGLQAPAWGLFRVLSGPPVMMSSIVPSLPSYTGRWSLACRLRSSVISSCCCCFFFWPWTCRPVDRIFVLFTVLLGTPRRFIQHWVNMGWISSSSVACTLTYLGVMLFSLLSQQLLSHCFLLLFPLFVLFHCILLRRDT